ncbi:hypothetical protein UFOVP592_2 [uncultured Caudovirales phage]|uniref:Uncharacterized protein n=1 Tax=uncultured Caudovirales phage TaxID=2100421 RepID=A0A6J5MZ97_9CAUD|nr:hypothetical protein UFOVP592_2 [uncultured Caudovirales phage]
MYYVNDNACPTLADAEEVSELYRAAGVPADIITEAEYYAVLQQRGVLDAGGNITKSSYIGS